MLYIYISIHEVLVSVHTYSGELTMRVAKVDVVFDGEVGHHLEELQEVLTRSLLIQVQSRYPVLAGIGTGI